MEIVCPVHNNGDDIQKISAIVKAGISSGSYSGPSGGLFQAGGQTGVYGGYTTLGGGSSTKLADAFANPMPSERSLGLPVILIVISGYLILKGRDPYDVFAHALCMEPIGIIGVLVGIVVFVNTFLHTQTLPTKLEEWERKKKILERLYYCHRDDIVFDPESKQSSLPDDWQNVFTS